MIKNLYALDRIQSIHDTCKDLLLSENKITMHCDGAYGIAILPKHLFDSLPAELLHTLDDCKNVKFMNSNKKETDYLKSIGCVDDVNDAVFDCVDWYKIEQITTNQTKG